MPNWASTPHLLYFALLKFKLTSLISAGRLLVLGASQPRLVNVSALIPPLNLCIGYSELLCLYPERQWERSTQAKV